MSNPSNHSNNSVNAFFTLLRAGLWEESVYINKDVDFDEILDIAVEQSVLGLITAGMERVQGSIIPKETILNYVGRTLQLEQQNKAMNAFIERLTIKLRCAGVNSVLVKGQGIAQCYKQPLWRTCGDIDLFLNDLDFSKARTLLEPLSVSIVAELVYERHVSMTIDNWCVELHGNLPSSLSQKIDTVLEDLQFGVFFNGEVRTWRNGNTDIFLPSVDNDILFIFTHILKHLFQGGIGLRQICDWCRLLWTYKDDIDYPLLSARLHKMGLMTEWKSFASLAVNTLGYPPEDMPFYNNDRSWKRKGEKITSFILDTGNFGQNRSNSYLKNHSYMIYKAISLWRHTSDSLRLFVIFPRDTMRVWFRMIKIGIVAAFKGQ